VTRFDDAIARFDAANGEDPVLEEAEGGSVPRGLLYAQRMSAHLDSFMSEASEALRLAVRAQHLKRFEMPRGDYPMDRAGYLLWRSDSSRHHAALAGSILREVGYDEAMVAAVEGIVRKKHRATNPESQALEDVACLVFLAHYCETFIAGKDDSAVVVILRKTWAKMSPEGQTAARALSLAERPKRLLERALA